MWPGLRLRIRFDRPTARFPRRRRPLREAKLGMDTTDHASGRHTWMGREKQDVRNAQRRVAVPRLSASYHIVAALRSRSALYRRLQKPRPDPVDARPLGDKTPEQLGRRLPGEALWLWLRGGLFRWVDVEPRLPGRYGPTWSRARSGEIADETRREIVGEIRREIE